MTVEGDSGNIEGHHPELALLGFCWECVLGWWHCLAGPGHEAVYRCSDPCHCDQPGTVSGCWPWCQGPGARCWSWYRPDRCPHWAPAPPPHWYAGTPTGHWTPAWGPWPPHTGDWSGCQGGSGDLLVSHCPLCTPYNTININRTLENFNPENPGCNILLFMISPVTEKNYISQHKKQISEQNQKLWNGPVPEYRFLNFQICPDELRWVSGQLAMIEAFVTVLYLQ